MSILAVQRRDRDRLSTQAPLSGVEVSSGIWEQGGKEPQSSTDTKYLNARVAFFIFQILLYCCTPTQRRSLTISCKMFPRTFLSLGVAALIATPAFALVHLGPRATDTFADAPDATGWTPKPTPAPLLSGSLSELKNRKRQDTVQALSETCGWYSADPSEPFSCDPGNACAFNTQNSYFGCCSTDASGYFISSDCAYIATPSAGCYDYTQASLCTGQCYYSNMIW